MPLKIATTSTAIVVAEALIDRDRLQRAELIIVAPCVGTST